eukprot:187128-Chlamydomonas_euryale.AAC.2
MPRGRTPLPPPLQVVLHFKTAEAPSPTQTAGDAACELLLRMLQAIPSSQLKLAAARCALGGGGREGKGQHRPRCFHKGASARSTPATDGRGRIPLQALLAPHGAAPERGWRLALHGVAPERGWRLALHGVAPERGWRLAPHGAAPERGWRLAPHGAAPKGGGGLNPKP